MFMEWSVNKLYIKKKYFFDRINVFPTYKRDGTIPNKGYKF